MAAQAAPSALRNDAEYERRVKNAENDCRVMSSAVHSVRILREGFSRLDEEHRAFGDVVSIEEEARNSTRRSLVRISMKAVEVEEALGMLFGDHERFVTVVSWTVSSYRIVQ